MAVSQLAPTELLEAYRSMLTIRRFEERVLELRRADVFAGSIHLCAGQEAVPVGALAALEDGDRVVATYRGHGWALACGVPHRAADGGGVPARDGRERRPRRLRPSDGA